MNELTRVNWSPLQRIRWKATALLSLVCAALVLTSQPADAQDSIELQTPRAGWRVQTEQGAQFSQAISYPASDVNSAVDQSEHARIRGRISAADKGPALLLVNGVAMPLKVDEQGGFDRPYIFPAGSNSVEIRDAARAATRRVQFHARNEGATPAKLRVLLAWDSDNTDLDLHVITPDGGHAWYGSQVLPNGGALDVDVTTGFGPEIFATPTPLLGTYLVYVNYFGGGYSEGEAAQALTSANVTIVSEEGTVNERQQTFTVPMRAVGELTLIKSFSYP